ncbi:sensor histidine kinase [Nocardioides massiliensis]|uniref:histidine kinase n=1 Tax=Nocardioides massiliensis TaxID=1325935 RepID=A0ABT9NLZ2_9ACTN|nr:HAMP domain-containing sensor histidine kinase [Nocardioides massiliensis]MDP9821443.1 two-component system sensor histidine kinase MprB [Nocardioides massiliensis]
MSEQPFAARVREATHYRRSLASRVTILTTVAVALTVAGVAASAYFTARVQMQQSLDGSLLSRAQQAAESNALSSLTAQEVPSWALGAADVRIAFVVPGRRQPVISAERGAAEEQLVLGDPEVAVAVGQSTRSIRTVRTPNGARYRVVAVPTDGQGALVLAQSLRPTEQTLGRLGLVMFLFGLLGVVGAGLTGWAVARNGLRPVRRLTAAAEEIARTEKLTPIDVEGNDEIARLATAFNAMLTALAASRDRQRQLVGDASHELRTPLTSLRTNIELLRQADAAGGLDHDARDELLADVGAQLTEMTTLIGDLVELARDEPLPHAVGPVDLAEVIDQAVRRVRLRAPGIGFVVETSSWWLTGEQASLERAVTNLLDNAAKWSPPLGQVTVTLADGELSVTDEGDGIAAEDLPHVFDRFYRSRESRSLPGSGLGLAIVHQVVTRHGGTVAATNAPDAGARFVVRLPGSPTPPAPDRAADDLWEKSAPPFSSGSGSVGTLES